MKLPNMAIIIMVLNHHLLIQQVVGLPRGLFFDFLNSCSCRWHCQVPPVPARRFPSHPPPSPPPPHPPPPPIPNPDRPHDSHSRGSQDPEREQVLAVAEPALTVVEPALQWWQAQRSGIARWYYSSQRSSRSVAVGQWAGRQAVSRPWSGR